jgi:hypothetical protein
MNVVYAVEFKSTNPKFNAFYHKRDIEEKMSKLDIIAEDETDWIEFAIIRVFGSYIIDGEYVFLKSPKCMAAAIDIPDIGAPVYFTKHFI